ncbi:hypothetical protein V6N13_129099 [Hibiscus sabdariffa]
MRNFLWLPHLILLLLLVPGVVCSSSHNPNTLCVSDDKSALLQFKSTMSTDGYFSCRDSYPKTKWWNESTNCCSWEGVTCDYGTGRIIGLDLSCSMLTGSFPQNTSLFRLKELKQLNLAFTDFNGSSIPHGFSQLGEFPSEIFQLGNLEYLDLSSNSLTGHLPKSNWSIPLRLLDLSGNQFRGSVPASLGNLTKITSLDFSDNLFEGQIPDVFGNLNKLTTLYFSSCSFSGQLPPSLFNLTQLTSLDLSSNGLEGPLPTNVTGLQNLKKFQSRNTLLTGVIPSWLFTLPSLESLDLSNNSLTGPIDEIRRPNTIQEVYLDHNDIHGEIPTSFFGLVNLESLETLDLSSNDLGGVAKLDVLSKLKNLSTLHLSNNKLLAVSSDSGVISTFQALQSLDLSSCNVSQFPNFLRSVKSLMNLDLSNNTIRGSILKWELEGWEQLVYLNLSHNFLTSIEQFPGKNLRILDLRSNLLQESKGKETCTERKILRGTS